MMKHLTGKAAAAALVVVIGLLATQVFGQVLTNVTVQWDPNPAVENVTGYIVNVDGNVQSPSGITCTATVCQLQVIGLSLGVHSVLVSAVNEWGTSPAQPVAFSISVPTVVKNVKTKRASNIP